MNQSIKKQKKRKKGAHSSEKEEAKEKKNYKEKIGLLNLGKKKIREEPKTKTHQLGYSIYIYIYI